MEETRQPGELDHPDNNRGGVRPEAAMDLECRGEAARIVVETDIHSRHVATALRIEEECALLELRRGDIHLQRLDVAGALPPRVPQGQRPPFRCSVPGEAGKAQARGFILACEIPIPRRMNDEIPAHPPHPDNDHAGRIVPGIPPWPEGGHSTKLVP